MPPPLGYGMGITFYSWSSDQLSQYGTKYVPVTVRDATYVLDELCNNETELPIREHTTDTAGATVIWTNEGADTKERPCLATCRRAGFPGDASRIRASVLHVSADRNGSVSAAVEVGCGGAPASLQVSI
jgi:TnpA family transposase